MAKSRARTKPKKSVRRAPASRAPGNAEVRAVDAALDLIAEQGWRELALEDVAARAELAADAVRALFPGREALLEVFFLGIDRKVAEGGRYGADDPNPARDRLFDVLMRRFDALGPRRKAIAALVRELPFDPAAAAAGCLRLCRSMAWTLETAGLPARGPLGPFKVEGLVLIYLNALRVWLSDETPDLGPTMAALDKGLRAAEKPLEVLSGLLGSLSKLSKAEGRKAGRKGAGAKEA